MLSSCWDAANNVYPIRRRNLLRLIGAYTIRQQTNNFQKITIQIYLHVGTRQIVHTQIRRCNLLRLIGAYTIRQVTTTFHQITVQFNFHVGMQQIVHTPIRLRTLLRLTGAYTIRRTVQNIRITEFFPEEWSGIG